MRLIAPQKLASNDNFQPDFRIRNNNGWYDLNGGITIVLLLLQKMHDFLRKIRSALASLPVGTAMVCVTFCSGITRGQVNTDSLLKLWQDNRVDEEIRFTAIYDVAWEFLFLDPDTAFTYDEKMLDFAKERGWKTGMAQANNIMGVSHQFRGNYEDALSCYRESITLYAEVNNYAGIAKVLNNVGNVHLSRADYDDAIQCYYRSYTANQLEADTLSMATAMQNIGNVYMMIGENDLAMKSFDKAIVLNSRMAEPDEDLEATALESKGTLFMDQGRFETAISHFEVSIRIFEKMNHQRGVAAGYHNLGDVKLRQGHLDSALHHVENSLEIRMTMDFRDDLPVTYNTLGRIYLELNDLAKAKLNAKKSLDLAQELGNLEISRAAATLLNDIYFRSGDYKDAYEMLALSNQIRDSLANNEHEKATSRLQLQHDYDKQEAISNAHHAAEINKGKELADAEHRIDLIVITSVSLGFILVVIFGISTYNRFRITRTQKQIIETQKLEVETKNREILDSITYAKRIQSAMLPDHERLAQLLPDSFVLYIPKDIVAGDFYWMEKLPDKLLFAVADCTGHGVPGAMMSVICNNALNRSVREFGLVDPGKILAKANALVEESFPSGKGNVKDGMDIAFCAVDLELRQISFAGANNPLWIIRNGEMIEIKADQMPIGWFKKEISFKTSVTELQKDDVLYLTTDGYADQFGGPKGKKFKTMRLKNLLLSMCDKSSVYQREELRKNFEDWKNDRDQIDDICVMGVRV